VAANNWNARRGLIDAQRVAWGRTATTDPAWRAYHNQHQGEEQAHWANEAARRETWAAQTDTRLGDQARAAREQTLAQTTAHPTPSPFGGRPGLAAWPSRGAAVSQGQRYADLGAQPRQGARSFGGAPQAAVATLDRSRPSPVAQRPDLFARRAAPADQRAFVQPQARATFAPQRRAVEPAPQSRTPAMFSQPQRAPAAAPMRAAPVFHPQPSRAAQAPAFHAAPAPQAHAPPPAAAHAAPANRPDKRG
jgi:hypothetical protein